MKKFICLAMSVMLLLSLIPSVFAEDPDQVEFTSELAGEIDRTSEEWMDTGSDRALLTVLLAIEAALDRRFGDSDVLHILSNETYLVQIETAIFLTGYTDGYIYLFIYSPSTKTVNLSRSENFIGSGTASAIKNALESTTSNTVYKNDDEEVLQWLQIAAEAVSE